MDLNPGLRDRLSKRNRQRLLKCVIVATVVVAALMVSLVSLAVAQPAGFPDVPSSNPYYAAINTLAERGIISGFTNGTFGPNNVIMRQQFAKMVVLTGGYPVSENDVSPFIDVDASGPGDLYPDNYIAVAAARGITLGKTETMFDPYAAITRYQVITMVVRMVADLKPTLLTPPPAAYQGSTGWGNDPQHGANAARAEYNGLLAGLNLNLSPYLPMTRGEVAQVLYNALNKLTPEPTTTTTAATTTTTASSTTTTGASTTTTAQSTTTTQGATTTTTSTTVPSLYAIAGLEAAQVVLTVRDQFGNAMPAVDVYLSSTVLEGQGLVVLNDFYIGQTDGNGNVAFSWGQDTGDWGVERVTARIDNNTPAGLIVTVALVQWILDDRGVDDIAAFNAQQKVEVVAGLAPWNGDVLKAYLAVGTSSIGQGTYVSAAGLTFTTSHTFMTGEAFYVGAVSGNTDEEPNWRYNLAQ